MSKFYNMSRVLYYLCGCFTLGHKWKLVGHFYRDLPGGGTCISSNEKEYPGGYSCRKCTLCNLIEKRKHLAGQAEFRYQWMVEGNWKKP